MSRLVVVLLGATLVAALGREPEFRQFRAVQESLCRVHPRFQERWLRSHGYDPAEFLPQGCHQPESSGLRLVGKWGRGPSVEVTGRDTLVALTLGSEVALLSFASPTQPRVLSEIQLDFLPAQSELTDSLLITGGGGMEVWNIADPAHPTRVSRFSRGAGAFCLQDSLVCFIALDTFWVYSIGDPANPRPLGFYQDSGYVFTSSGSIVVAGHPDAGLYFVDISNPALPHRVGAWPGWALSAVARGNLCCAAFADPNQPDRSWFLTLDISNPVIPRQLGRCDGVCGMDIFVVDSIAFISGRGDRYEEFQIVSIADSTRPRLMSTCYLRRDNWGIWANIPQGRAFVANTCNGLAVIDITNLNAPHLDTNVLRADLAEDISVADGYAYVADYRAGMRVLRVKDPTVPVEVASVDSALSTSEAVVAQDSFAYMCWWDPPPLLRVIDITDPARPTKVGGLDLFERPKDMVIKDTLLYIAERLRFQVVNVARPRSPVLVGSCNLSGDVWDMDMEGNLAYVTSSYFTIIDAARPDSPRVISQWSQAEAVDVVDTIAYQAYGGLRTVSVANPRAPYLLDSMSVYDITSDVVVVDSLAIVSGYKLHLFNVADPRNVRKVGEWSAPGWGRRLVFVPPYIYACCYSAGVCILETTLTGIAEPEYSNGAGPKLRVWPTVVTSRAYVEVAGVSSDIALYNVTGARVLDVANMPQTGTPSRCRELDVSALRAGVYIVKADIAGSRLTAKVVKTKGR